MRLINPTDAELNAAFAEKVAGLAVHNLSSGPHVRLPTVGGHGLGPMPNYCTSADAVLPWLEKWPLTDAQLCPGAGQKWVVEIVEKSGMMDKTVRLRGTGDTLPRASVIALLRTHGVEVVFS